MDEQLRPSVERRDDAFGTTAQVGSGRQRRFRPIQRNVFRRRSFQRVFVGFGQRIRRRHSHQKSRGSRIQEN